MAIRTPCDDKLGGHVKDRSGPCSPGILLAAVVLGSSMAFIDGSVVGVAMPAIQKDLGASLAAMQWVVNGYTLMLGAFILIGGSLGDHFGRKKIFLMGITLFAAASLLCGLAPSASILIAARILQGLGGALLVPGSLAIISAAFAEEERGKAIGVWAAGSAISSALGPILGGWLVDNVSWRSAFYINLPLAVATILLALKGVPESKNTKSPAIDWLSAALAVLSLGGVSYGLIQGPEGGWTKPDVLAMMIAGAALLGVFVWRQLAAKHPMTPPELFKSRTFSGVNVMTLLLYGALAGALFFLPYNLIQVHHYSAAAAGAALLPFAVLLGGFSRWAGGLAAKFGSKLPLTIGPLVVACGFLLMAFQEGSSYWASVFPGVFTLGIGMTITVAPLTAAVMGSIPSEQSGVASGINNAVSRIAGLLAVAALAAVMTSVYVSSLRQQSSAISDQARNQLETTANQLLAAPLPEGLSSTEKDQIEKLRVEGFLKGYRLVMIIAAALGALSAGVAAATIPSRTNGARAPALSGANVSRRHPG